jgi:N-acetylneuraminate synthase
MNNKIIIGSRTIGVKSPPFIIAEMSGNHNQSLKRALQIVEEAAKAGAHALKLQTYTADTMTLDIDKKEFFINSSESLWKGKSLYQLYQKAYTPWQWHKPIFDKCNQLGLIGFSTPFEETAVDFLESLNVPAYKIASFENTHIPLIKKAASTGKPIIMSAGMSSIAELEQSITAAKKAGAKDIILLKCTSAYPASPSDANLLTIPHLKNMFGIQIGLSDHTMGLGVALASIPLGATVIEKHFTINRADGGVDSVFSMEPQEMAMLVKESKRAWEALGKIKYGGATAEKESKIFRRSVYISDDIKKGEVFTKKNLRIIRPGLGLSPKYYEILVGKKVNKNIKKGTPASWDLIG